MRTTKLRVIFSSILFLFFIPQLCSANMAIGWVSYSLPLFAIISFLSVLVIETKIILKKLLGLSRKAFFVSLLVNCLTLGIGLLLWFALNNTELAAHHIFGIQFFFFFILSFIIEGVIAYLFYREQSFRKVVKVSFLMNFASYGFLFIFSVLDTFPLTGPYVGPVLAAYFIHQIIKFLRGGKSFSKLQKASLYFIYTLIAVGIMLFSLSQMPDSSRSKAKDSRIVSAIEQARVMMTYFYANEGRYDNFSCEVEDILLLCEEIGRHGSGPVIVLSDSNDSQEACIYSPMNRKMKTGWFSKEDTWYCADSYGNVGRTVINPASTGYCVEGESAICPPFTED